MCRLTLSLVVLQEFRPVCFFIFLNGKAPRHFLPGKGRPIRKLYIYTVSISRAPRQWPEGMGEITFVAAMKYTARHFIQNRVVGRKLHSVWCSMSLHIVGLSYESQCVAQGLVQWSMSQIYPLLGCALISIIFWWYNNILKKVNKCMHIFSRKKI